MASYDLQTGLRQVGQSLCSKYDGLHYYVDREMSSFHCRLTIRDLKTDRSYGYSVDEMAYSRYSSDGMLQGVYDEMDYRISKDKKEYRDRMEEITYKPYKYSIDEFATGGLIDTSKIPTIIHTHSDAMQYTNSTVVQMENLPPVAKKLSKKVISGIANYGKY